MEQAGMLQSNAAPCLTENIGWLSTAYLRGCDNVKHEPPLTSSQWVCNLSEWCTATHSVTQIYELYKQLASVDTERSSV
jgi:hypothetical protein